ncbi:hypothetical protein D0864_00040 [Hortaea werneckii]|uniref:Uncharacterized protein n=1 Tax=Hortaea werneckii TaxID=91943 RepID=A0A3M7HNX8_HORWE|nr:hypothetical protein D0864_00040 [Hortaea werneckii]
MLVDDHLLYHPSWDRPDPRPAELYKPPPACLRPTVNKRHHSVCALLRLLWQTESQAVSRRDASLGGLRICSAEGEWGDHLVSSLSFSRNLIDSPWSFKGSDRNTIGARKSLVPWKGKSAGDGKAFVCFDNLRDAGEAFKQVEMLGKDWVIKHVTQTEFASNIDAGNAKDGTTFYFDANKACDAARVTAEKAGELRAFTEIPSRYLSRIPRRILCD